MSEWRRGALVFEDARPGEQRGYPVEVLVVGEHKGRFRLADPSQKPQVDDLIAQGAEFGIEIEPTPEEAASFAEGWSEAAGKPPS